MENPQPETHAKSPSREAPVSREPSLSLRTRLTPHLLLLARCAPTQASQGTIALSFPERIGRIETQALM